LSVDKYSAIIEAILFCENDVVKPDKIAKITGLTKHQIDKIIKELSVQYDKEEHGISVSEVAEGYSMQIKKEVYPFIKEFYNVRQRHRLSKSILTVLSIIAYKQPVTKVEVDDIRGVASDLQIKKLLEIDYIEILGRKDTVGKPLLYGTTNTFLKHFNLKNIKDLPQIDELKSEEFSLEEQ
jgi:segregation and condensation protein B